MKMLIITSAAVFAAIFIESLMLILQYKKRLMSRLFKGKDFWVHSFVTALLWLFMFTSIILLQYEEHIIFHNIFFLEAGGVILFSGGLFISVWAFILMGFKRSAGINFYRENVPIEKRGPYRFISNPQAGGMCWAALGLALMTGSIYNLIIAVQITALMIPHTMLENRPLKD